MAGRKDFAAMEQRAAARAGATAVQAREAMRSRAASHLQQARDSLQEAVEVKARWVPRSDEPAHSSHITISRSTLRSFSTTRKTMSPWPRSPNESARIGPSGRCG